MRIAAMIATITATAIITMMIATIIATITATTIIAIIIAAKKLSLGIK